MVLQDRRHKAWGGGVSIQVRVSGERKMKKIQDRVRNGPGLLGKVQRETKKRTLQKEKKKGIGTKESAKRTHRFGIPRAERERGLGGMTVLDLREKGGGSRFIPDIGEREVLCGQAKQKMGATKIHRETQKLRKERSSGGVDQQRARTLPIKVGGRKDKEGGFLEDRLEGGRGYRITLKSTFGATTKRKKGVGVESVMGKGGEGGIGTSGRAVGEFTGAGGVSKRYRGGGGRTHF